MKIRLAGCVIQNSRGQILLLHRNTPNRTQWETPGGKIEEGEDSRKTAMREIEEELGIKVNIVKELGKRDFDEDGFTMSYVWYKAIILSGEPKIMEGKFDELRFFSWEALQGIKSELSANTRNLVNAYFGKSLSL